MGEWKPAHANSEITDKNTNRKSQIDKNKLDNTNLIYTNRAIQIGTHKLGKLDRKIQIRKIQTW